MHADMSHFPYTLQPSSPGYTQKAVTRDGRVLGHIIPFQDLNGNYLFDARGRAFWSVGGAELFIRLSA